MKQNALNSILVLLIPLLFLGCVTHDVQTTSGTDYISRYPSAENVKGDLDIDREVLEVANVEPTLRFPARIGLAKVYNGKMVNLVPEEVDRWNVAKEHLGDSFGDFIPVSVLVAESVYQNRNPRNPNARASELLRKVRLGAARQHLDAVLIYEVFSETKGTSLATSVADWTIIGAYVIPSEEIETTGYASALLIDVRSGYPYGTASASITEKDLSTTFSSYDKRRNMEDANQVASALKLIPEVEKMFLELIKELGKNDNPSIELTDS